MVSLKFYQEDCLNVLPELRDVNLIITDPPYNIGWKYSSKVNDRKKDYHSWCLEWAELCFRSLDNNGILCVINYPENNNILYTDLIRKGYNFVQQLIWKYPTNVGQSKKKYTRSYRTILIFSKTKDYKFNSRKQQYKNPTDKRIKERIAQGHLPTHYDVFDINMCKNVSKDKKNNGINQLPRELVKLLIKSYSNPKDIVLDPFVGNGTVMNIAEELDRVGYGIDINDYNKPEVNSCLPLTQNSKDDGIPPTNELVGILPKIL